MKKQFLYLLLVLVSFNLGAQNEKSIDNYKYIIVKERFDFLKEIDQYQTSSLTKFLFEKEAFTVFLSNESMPRILAGNKCHALMANVVDNSGMFFTKVVIELKDCYGTTVFTSDSGKSKEKQYKRAYHEAIRSAFESIIKLNYSYLPIRDEALLSHERNSSVVLKKPTAVASMSKKDEINVVKEPLINAEIIPEKQPQEMLYAQSTPNGFQLVNTEPVVVFSLLKTSVENVFIIEDKNGILYEKDGIWIADYYQETQLIKEVYLLKF
jgi:hypothetical protein